MKVDLRSSADVRFALASGAEADVAGRQLRANSEIEWTARPPPQKKSIVTADGTWLRDSLRLPLAISEGFAGADTSVLAPQGGPPPKAVEEKPEGTMVCYLIAHSALNAAIPLAHLRGTAA